jgi:signal peptidase I
MIKKIRLVFLSGLLAALAGCGKPSLTLIPEVSPPLIQEEVFAWTGQAVDNAIFPCAEGIGWVDASGQIVTCNPEKKAAGRVFHLPFAVSSPLFHQGDYLVLKSQADDQLLTFDLARMKTSFEAKDLKTKRILGVDGDHLVYLDGENLVVYRWQDPAGIFRWPTAENEFFNCHFFPDRILIMSSRQLFVFWKSNGKFQLLPLPLEAAGEFLCQGENIFYGSSQRQLVKYSLRKNMLVWKLKLGHNLQRQPLIAAGTVVVSPDDNNVMQLNGQGSVHWWLALHSILQFNLVPMADHLAAFLLNHEIRFINLRRQQVTVFKIDGRPDGMPLAYNHDLYFFLTSGNMQKLQRVGNQYGIGLTLTPDKTQWLGVPITFTILTSNLLKPHLHIVIRAEAGPAVLTKDFTLADRVALVWIPALAGTYRMQVSAAALNRNEEREIFFQVFDPQKIVPEFHFHF